MLSVVPNGLQSPVMESRDPNVREEVLCQGTHDALVVGPKSEAVENRPARRITYSDTRAAVHHHHQCRRTTEIGEYLLVNIFLRVGKLRPMGSFGLLSG